MADRNEPAESDRPLSRRVFSHFDAWKYRGWVIGALLVIFTGGVLVLGEVGVRLPYWLLALIGVVLVFGTFGIIEWALRRRARAGPDKI